MYGFSLIVIFHGSNETGFDMKLCSETTDIFFSILEVLLVLKVHAILLCQLKNNKNKIASIFINFWFVKFQWKINPCTSFQALI